MSDQTPSPTGAQPETIDLEEYAKAGRQVPPINVLYKIRIDRQGYVVSTPKITGREILALAGKTPEQYILHQKLRGGATRTIEADEEVDLTGAGPERFMTLKREAQEGLTKARRLFRLAQADEAFLNETYPNWEALTVGAAQWLVLPAFRIPDGYTTKEADLAIELTAGYPDAALDMAYFSPALARADGKDIPALSPSQFDGRSWQRWSRHRLSDNPWVVGEDCIATHISYITSFLESEFRRRP